MALSSHGPLTAPWISHLPSAGEKLTSTESSPTYHILQCLISVRACLKTGIEHTRTFTPPNSASEHGAPKPTTTSSLMSHDPEIPIASGLLDLLSSHDQPSKWIYSSVVQHYKSSLHDRSSDTTPLQSRRPQAARGSRQCVEFVGCQRHVVRPCKMVAIQAGFC